MEIDNQINSIVLASTKASEESVRTWYTKLITLPCWAYGSLTLKHENQYCSTKFSRNVDNAVMSCENNLKNIKLQYSDSGRPDSAFSCTQLQLLMCSGVRSGSSLRCKSTNINNFC